MEYKKKITTIFCEENGSGFFILFFYFVEKQLKTTQYVLNLPNKLANASIRGKIKVSTKKWAGVFTFFRFFCNVRDLIDIVRLINSIKKYNLTHE